ncbi:MAG: hypothetical protein D6767_11150 [Candidatus Hydrogenedentota bacterium]|nr:MAG: hypothetical protein D6767_11150 [Candidatus Hydrogenedentota bacterium]
MKQEALGEAELSKDYCYHTNDFPYAEKCRHCSGFEEKLEPAINNSLWKEIAESEKHEIICSISQFLGNDPCKLAEAEEIFNSIKYAVAEYVLKYEYNQHQKLSLDLTLWLEQKKSPHRCTQLNEVIQTYLK